MQSFSIPVLEDFVWFFRFASQAKFYLKKQNLKKILIIFTDTMRVEGKFYINFTESNLHGFHN